MKIGVFQLDTTFSMLNKNMKFIEEKMSTSDAELFVAPELFNTGYDIVKIRKNAQNSEKILNWAINLAKKYKKAFIPGTLGVIKGEKLFNILYFITPEGKILTKYAKIHLFTLSGEDEIFDAGREIVVAEFNGFKIGFAICYDLRFPEMFRILREKGAELIILPANWPESRLSHWETLTRARAIENHLYFLGVNRTGYDMQVKFGGNSVFFSPWGKTLFTADDIFGFYEIEANKNVLLESRERFDSFSDRKGHLYKI